MPASLARKRRRSRRRKHLRQAASGRREISFPDATISRVHPSNPYFGLRVASRRKQRRRPSNGIAASRSSTTPRALLPRASRWVAASRAARAARAAGYPVLARARGHPDPVAAGCRAQGASASGCPGPAVSGSRGLVRAVAASPVASRDFARPDPAVCGWYSWDRRSLLSRRDPRIAARGARRRDHWRGTRIRVWDRRLDAGVYPGRRADHAIRCAGAWPPPGAAFRRTRVGLDAFWRDRSRRRGTGRFLPLRRAGLRRCWTRKAAARQQAGDGTHNSPAWVTAKFRGRHRACRNSRRRCGHSRASPRAPRRGRSSARAPTARARRPPRSRPGLYRR